MIELALFSLTVPAAVAGGRPRRRSPSACRRRRACPAPRFARRPRRRPWSPPCPRARRSWSSSGGPSRVPPSRSVTVTVDPDTEATVPATEGWTTTIAVIVYVPSSLRVSRKTIWSPTSRVETGDGLAVLRDRGAGGVDRAGPAVVGLERELRAVDRGDRDRGPSEPVPRARGRRARRGGPASAPSGEVHAASLTTGRPVVGGRQRVAEPPVGGVAAADRDPDREDPDADHAGEGREAEGPAVRSARGSAGGRPGLVARSRAGCGLGFRARGRPGRRRLSVRRRFLHLMSPASSGRGDDRSPGAGGCAPGTGRMGRQPEGVLNPAPTRAPPAAAVGAGGGRRRPAPTSGSFQGRTRRSGRRRGSRQRRLPHRIP